MPIKFSCPHCGEEMSVDDKYAGTTGPCRNCQNTITIPGHPVSDAAPPRRQSSPGVWIAILVCGLFVALVCGSVLLALLLPAVNAAREAARRSGCMNNQRQIAMAIINYESANGKLPPAYSVDENGEPLHSWRVLILPYLEERGLYDQLDLTKPWDDPANLAITQSNMPPTYQCPSDAQVGGDTNTNYVVVVDETTAFPPGGTQKRIGDIRDGVSKTVAVLESAGPGVHWAEPTDVTLKELDQIGSDHVGGGFNAVFIDGHVTFLSDVTAADLRSLVGIDDGEEVPGH